LSEQRKDEAVTRQERREQRLNKKKEKMPQHGRGLARVYKQAIEKRIGQLDENKDKAKR
jgi:hypothetical protein